MPNAAGTWPQRINKLNNFARMHRNREWQKVKLHTSKAYSSIGIGPRQFCFSSWTMTSSEANLYHNDASSTQNLIKKAFSVQYWQIVWGSRANLVPRTVLGWCHLANLMAWSQSHCSTIYWKFHGNSCDHRHPAMFVTNYCVWEVTIRLKSTIF